MILGNRAGGGESGLVGGFGGGDDAVEIGQRGAIVVGDHAVGFAHAVERLRELGGERELRGVEPGGGGFVTGLGGGDGGGDLVAPERERKARGGTPHHRAGLEIDHRAETEVGRTGGFGDGRAGDRQFDPGAQPREIGIGGEDALPKGIVIGERRGGQSGRRPHRIGRGGRKAERRFETDTRGDEPVGERGMVGVMFGGDVLEPNLGFEAGEAAAGGIVGVGDVDDFAHGSGGAGVELAGLGDVGEFQPGVAKLGGGLQDGFDVVAVGQGAAGGGFASERGAFAGRHEIGHEAGHHGHDGIGEVGLKREPGIGLRTRRRDRGDRGAPVRVGGLDLGMMQQGEAQIIGGGRAGGERGLLGGVSTGAIRLRRGAEPVARLTLVVGHGGAATGEGGDKREAEEGGGRAHESVTSAINPGARKTLEKFSAGFWAPGVIV